MGGHQTRLAQSKNPTQRRTEKAMCASCLKKMAMGEEADPLSDRDPTQGASYEHLEYDNGWNKGRY